jgi:multiple sugar transport system permease protein
MDRRGFGSVVTRGLIGFALVVTIFPIYWSFLLSFKTVPEALANPPLFLFDPTTDNYVDVSQVIGPYLFNSIVVAAGATALSVAAGTLGAYAFSRFRFRLKNSMMFIILATLMLPPIVIVVPIFFLWSRFNLVGSVAGILLAHAVFNTPFVTWMMRAFFDDVPREIEEAGFIDGASRFQVFRLLALPLAASGLVAVAVLSAFYSWNEFLFALVLSGPASRTIPVYIATFQRETTEVQWGNLGAAIVLTLIPIVTFTIAIQRYLVRGLTFGAVKG